MPWCWSGWCEYLEEGYVLKNDKAEFEGGERGSCGSFSTGMKHHTQIAFGVVSVFGIFGEY